MTEQELTQAIKDGRTVSQQIEIRDPNREIKTSCFDRGEEGESETEFYSNINCSTDFEVEKTNIPDTRVTGTELRRSKR